MKTSSGLFLSVLLLVAAVLFLPDISGAADLARVPNLIGNVNNPYVLPDSGEPGFWFSAVVGLAAGLLSASIGAGGGLIVVPALMSTGISGIYAIGSEIFRLFIFSFIQSIRLGIRRSINYVTAVILTAGTMIGGLAGYSVSKTVFLADPAGSDVFISSMIVLWLVVYSFILVPEFREAAREYALEQLRKEKEEQDGRAAIRIDNSAPDEKGIAEGSDSEAAEKEKQPEKGVKEETQFEDEQYPDEEPWPIARTMRTLKFPPYVRFPGTVRDEQDDLEKALSGGRDSGAADLDHADDSKYERIPAIPVMLMSVVGGFFMALTGSGGVVLSFTLLTKGFGCVAALVAGTDLARLAVSCGALSMSTYGLDGFINIYCITGLVFGTSTGVHLGSKALQHILPYQAKGLASLLVISVMLNRVLALPGLLNKAGAGLPSGLAGALEQSGNWILLIGAATFCGWFLFCFARGIAQSLTPPVEPEKKEEKK
ncbi:TSUP family transporter [Maridesulfovibrio sp.]|uniref:sulfite exporter TauE/SafE family protein n=1 Tax=Maridesulfovibrio sp. TaxID=2795000 RepID=UPI002A1880E8|nr:TSUP family transporter [Maridesulfovibrio sp.]